MSRQKYKGFVNSGFTVQWKHQKIINKWIKIYFLPKIFNGHATKITFKHDESRKLYPRLRVRMLRSKGWTSRWQRWLTWHQASCPPSSTCCVATCPTLYRDCCDHSTWASQVPDLTVLLTLDLDLTCWMDCFVRWSSDWGSSSPD